MRFYPRSDSPGVAPRNGWELLRQFRLPPARAYPTRRRAGPRGSRAAYAARASGRASEYQSEHHDPVYFLKAATTWSAVKGLTR